MNGEKIKSNWVYGGIFPQNGDGDFAIIYQQKPTIAKYTVYADTVGQYTGMVDMHGTKIFEGDIVDFVRRTVDDGYGVVRYNAYRTEFEIEYDTFREKMPAKCVCGLGRFYESEDVEVIGNIHDNPELLKG